MSEERSSTFAIVLRQNKYFLNSEKKWSKISILLGEKFAFEEQPLIAWHWHYLDLILTLNWIIKKTNDTIELNVRNDP